MNFALDITNPRIRSAMDKLGIEKTDLQIKTLNDFGNKGTRDEIKQLRFDYYSRRLEETVKLVKNSMQPLRSKTKDTTTKTFVEEDLFEKTSIPQVQVDRKVFLNERNKDVLMNALEEIKEMHWVPERKERPKSMANPRNRLSKVEQFKKSQQENIIRIRDSEEIKVRKALSQTFNYSKPTSKTPRSQHPTKTESKSFRFAPVDLEIAEKLAKFDEKLEKSRMLHDQQILMKKESARTQQSIGKLSSITDENPNGLLIKIIERSRAVSERREKRKQEVQEKWEKVKNFKEQRAKKIEEIEKEFRKTIQNKELSLEKKLMAAEKVVQNRKASVGKEIELRMEAQRLKDEEAQVKKEMILEKQVNDSLKFEAVKVSKEVANSKKRDQAIQEMIEKERVQEVVGIIKKSPQSKVAVELLKEFKLMPEKKSEEPDQ